MITDCELHRRLSEQPLARMRYFAAILGWRGLQLEYVRLSDEEAARGQIPHGLVIYYITTDLKFNLQINTYPHGQCRIHKATVKADRYGIVHVGWHDFELHGDDQRLQQEVERLSPWLTRKNFKDRTWRRQFAKEHPELPIRQSRRNKQS